MNSSRNNMKKPSSGQARTAGLKLATTIGPRSTTADRSSPSPYTLHALGRF